MLSPSSLWYQTVQVLGIPSDPSCPLSPDCFTHTNHTALQVILHFLLLTLHKLPTAHTHLTGCQEFTQLHYTLIHCYPVYEQTQRQEFIQMCYAILLALERSKTVAHPVFPIGSIRKSHLQQPQGDKINSILFYLSSHTLQLYLIQHYPDLYIPQVSASMQDRSVYSKEIIQALDTHIQCIQNDTAQLTEQYTQEQEEWKHVAQQLQDKYIDIKTRMNELQKEELALKAQHDASGVFTESRQQQRQSDIAVISQTYERIRKFVDNTKESRTLVDAVFTGQWKPLFLTNTQLRQAANSNNNVHTQTDIDNNSSNNHSHTTLPQFIRQWTQALQQLQQAFQQYQTQTAATQTADTLKEYQQQLDQQRTLQIQIDRVKEQVQQLTQESGRKRESEIRKEDEKSDKLCPVSLCPPVCERDGAMDDEVNNVMLISSQPLVSLADLHLEESDSESRLQSVGKSTTTGSALTSQVFASTPARSSSATSASAGTLFSPPSYMFSGGGLLDGDHHDHDDNAGETVQLEADAFSVKINAKHPSAVLPLEW